MPPKIYQVASDPYLNDNNQWTMNILWVDADTQTQGQGQIVVPFVETGEVLKKYFRHNVEPLDNDQTNKLIEDSIKGIRQ
jgi:hypothetical protein